MAASLRVNSDTVGDDGHHDGGHQGGLADLDELASGDLLATLARIVTGETQIEVRSLQQALAEANAGRRTPSSATTSWWRRRGRSRFDSPTAPASERA